MFLVLCKIPMFLAVAPKASLVAIAKTTGLGIFILFSLKQQLVCRIQKSFYSADKTLKRLFFVYSVYRTVIARADSGQLDTSVRQDGDNVKALLGHGAVKHPTVLIGPKATVGIGLCHVDDKSRR